jgi:hypothetical protein
MHASLERQLEQHGEPGRDAITKELQQLLSRGVWTPIAANESPKASPLPSKIFLKEKFDADGNRIKTKARLVAGGHRQERGVEDYSSPTVTTEALMTVLAISAAKGHSLASIDVEAAYLEVNIDRTIFMRLDKTVSKLLCEVDNKYHSSVRRDGTIIVELVKSLYGTVQASKLWFEKLSGVLKDAGFKSCAYDSCVFTMGYDSVKCIHVCVHVDDILISASDDSGIKIVERIMSKAFKSINLSTTSFTYLGLKVDEHIGGVRVSMDGYVSDCLKDMKPYLGSKNYVQPSTKDIFRTFDDDSPLNDEKAALFRSFVGKLMFLAKRVRPDILTAVSHLSSRVSCSTIHDWEELVHLGGYLNGTRHYCIDFLANVDPILSVYVDASFCVEEDYKSRTGGVLCLAGGCICAVSKKQAINAKSSTEAEIIALSDISVYALWLRELLIDLGYEQGATKLFEDNKSAITILEEAYNHRKETRHVNARYFFVKDRIAQGELEVCFVPTTDMLADVMTKTVDGQQLKHLLSSFMTI